MSFKKNFEFKHIVTRSYKIKVKCKVSNCERMIVVHGGTDSFQIIKFLNEHNCNLPRLE